MYEWIEKFNCIACNFYILRICLLLVFKKFYNFVSYKTSPDKIININKTKCFFSPFDDI